MKKRKIEEIFICKKSFRYFNRKKNDKNIPPLAPAELRGAETKTFISRRDFAKLRHDLHVTRSYGFSRTRPEV